MTIHQAYRYELNPNNRQRTLLAKHAGTARFAWNWALARRIERFENNQGKDKFSNAVQDHKAWNSWKKDNAPWAYEVSKCAPQEAFRNLDKAFVNFWQGRKVGRQVGWPKFKKKGCRDSWRYSTGAMKCLERSVQLPRVGQIGTKETTDLKGRILAATVTRQADRWFVSFTVERERAEPTSVVGPAVGIDLGINCFAVLSNGERMASPRPLHRSLKRLGRLQKKHARKQPGSCNRRKSALGLARLHRKIRNRRSDFLHKTTTRLAKTKSTIVVEDLPVKNLSASAKGTKEMPGKNVKAKAGLNRSIVDQGWGEFRRQLEYKTVWYGSELVVAPAFHASSKTCSICGQVKDDLSLQDRTWTCDNCHTSHDRDLNAAQNLEQLTTASSAESHACGECSDGEAAKAASSYHSLKQEGNAEYPNGIFG